VLRYDGDQIRGLEWHVPLHSGGRTLSKI
jgi:hypothetical protein